MRKIVQISFLFVVLCMVLSFFASASTETVTDLILSDEASLNSDVVEIVDDIPDIAIEDSLFVHIPGIYITDKAISSVNTTLQLFSEMEGALYDIGILRNPDQYKALRFYPGNLENVTEKTVESFVKKASTRGVCYYLIVTDSYVFVYGYWVSGERGEYFLPDYSLNYPVSQLIMTEIQSVQKYMVFDGRICQVESVIPIMGQYGQIAFFYKTDNGIYVKYFESEHHLFGTLFPREYKDTPLLFTEEEFTACRTTIYEERKAKREALIEKLGYIPVGGEELTLSEIEALDLKYSVCEPGNPVPEHLQAELNALLGVGTTPEVDVGSNTDSSSNVATTDVVGNTDLSNGKDNATDEESSFPWLWIALPVGVVAVIGGAAVILLRRKKKPTPAAAEE